MPPINSELMTQKSLEHRRRLLAAGQLKCDCGRVATHLDSAHWPECDDCPPVLAKINKLHHVHRHQWHELLPPELKQEYERCRNRKMSALLIMIRASIHFQNRVARGEA